MALIDMDFALGGGGGTLQADTCTNGLSHNVDSGITEGYLLVSCYGNIFSGVIPTLTISGCNADLITQGGALGTYPIYWLYKISNLSPTISVSYSTGSTQYFYTYMQIFY